MQRLWKRAFDLLTHAIILVPLVLTVWSAVQGRLGANPIREAQLRTGRTALALLVLSLAGTPVFALTHNRWALVLRRRLGLYAFFYASLHFVNFVAIDYGFNFALIREDLFQKRYAVVGFAAFLLLIPLVITSTRRWAERLRKNWKRLHRLVYAAAVLGVVHLYWSLRVDKRLAIVYGGALLFLLMLRLPWLQRALSQIPVTR